MGFLDNFGVQNLLMVKLMMTYPENFEVKIGFDQIRELIKKKCLSENGKDKADKMSFSSSAEIIRTCLNETNEFLLINREEEFPLGFFADVSESLDRIRVEGSHLELQEVFDLRRSLDTVRAILNFFKKEKKEKYSNLSKLCYQVKYFPFIAERIDKILTKSGKLKDNASKELVQIRQSISVKHSTVTRILGNLLRTAREEGFAEKDAEVSIRNGRPVIPVNAAYKRKIRGIIHDESATGKTSFVEPAEAVELNNEIKELEYAEIREIIRILTILSDDLRPYIDELLNANEFLAKIDFIRAKALFADEIGAILPELAEENIISWKNAVHPLLLLAHRKDKKEVVPLTIDLNAKQRILLISGPNAGGKSVCLKTVGLLQYMLQCGLLVPMEESSIVGIFDRIFIDIGDEQSIENDLSTYSSHLLNMKYFVRNADSSTLLLIDEFGAGTEPVLGGAIAEAVLDKLNLAKIFAVITTHYSNLKHFAASVEGIENGAMLFDTQRMQPLFRLETGQPGSSFAFEIARNIGLSEEIIKTATDKIGKDYVRFDRHLKEIIRDKKYWQVKRDNIRKAEKRLQQVLDQYSEELELSEKSRKEILDKAHHEADQLLSDANRKIENTIREIREAQAEKEKTKKVREELELLRKGSFEMDAKDEKAGKDKLIQKISEVKSEAVKVRERRRRFGQLEPARASASKIIDPEIKKGDFVFMKGQDVAGEVINRKGNKVTVRFGQLSTIVDVSRLDKTTTEIYEEMNSRSSAGGDFADWNPGERKLFFKPEIDVRGKRSEEALREVTVLLDEAIMVGATEVRILHGKGDGILRQVIREYLRTVDVVASCKDEHIQLGGSGITVVTLEL
jgi:DNA mismatch repair protein MutS2